MSDIKPDSKEDEKIIPIPEFDNEGEEVHRGYFSLMRVMFLFIFILLIFQLKNIL